MDYIIETLLDINQISAIVRILLAMLCGAVMGYERGKKNKAAGMRTYMLVCIGAAVVMVTGEFCFKGTQAGDVARLGAQVISGIGFLGAGIIVFSDNRIRGLTTAAGLWTSACIGLACGAGLYLIAPFATFLVCFVSGILIDVGAKATGKATWFRLTFEYTGMKTVWFVEEKLKELNFFPTDISIKQLASGGDHRIYTSNLKNKGTIGMSDLYDELKKINGVLHVTLEEA